jgi:hypothetical protein
MSTKMGFTHTATGLSTLYACVTDPNNDGKYARVSDHTWQAKATDLANFATTVSEVAAGTYRYQADFPTWIAAGVYDVEFYEQLGSGRAAGDPLRWVTEAFNWNGTARVAGSFDAATGLLDLAGGVETGVTVRQLLRAIGAIAGGKRSNVGTASEQYDAIGNPGTPRVVGNENGSGNGTPTLTL